MKKLFYILLLLLTAGSVMAQVPQANFKSVVWYDIWSYYEYPPHRMQYNGMTDLVMFGGGTAGIEPSTTSPYLPFRNYSSFAYGSIMHGDGWSSKQTFFPSSTGTWIQLIRDSCTAHGVNLILDLGGEWGSPATAFNDLIANRSRWETYFTALDEACLNNPDGVRFDGVSLDIEWLNTETAQGRTDFADFITALKAHLNAWPGKPGRLGMAVAMWFLWSDNPATPYMTAATANQFDWLFIMGYNTFNSSRLGFEAQVYQHPSISGVEVWDDRATTQFTANGVNPGVVVLGTSGEVLKQTITGSAVPGGSASGSTTGSGSGPRVNQIFDTAVLDPVAKSAYAVDGNTWYSFETVASVNEKIKIAQSYHLGGIGYYSTYASNSGTGATSINKPLNAYQNSIAAVIGGFTAPADSIDPVITLNSPADGDTISSAQLISASASDNLGVQRVEFLVNAAIVATVYSSPYQYVWTPTGSAGARIVSAKAYDVAGNTTATPTVTVFVQPPPPPVAKPWIYQDTLQSPWKDSSWNSTNSYKNNEQVYSGTYSLKAVQTAWGALSVRSGSFGSGLDVDPSKYSRFEFAIYNTTPGLVLNVYCYNDQGDVFPDVLQNNVPTNQWTIISVPMDQLNPNQYVIHRVNVQNYTRLNPVYYLDQMHFVDNTTDVVPDGQPMTYALQQNYPNPFNPTTRIEYSLASTSKISLKVYDVLGEEITTLVDGVQGAGVQSIIWNATDRSGYSVPSGMYFYKLEATKNNDPTSIFVSIKKMVLLK